jgi:CBS domain-containing protein
MLVREALRLAPVTVPPGCTLREAADIMARHGVGALLVLDGDTLVGIVTDRDIVVRGVARGGIPDAGVDSVMTTEVTTISGGAELQDAYRMFRERVIRRLPVVEEGELAGMLSVDDLLIRSTAELADLVQPITGEAPPGLSPAQSTGQA